MPYESPSFVEIKMDAEIGSYQDDFEFDRDDPINPRPPFARPQTNEPEHSAQR
ncbi:MAG: hypothetical protein OXU20_09460 [Myxococcales bacterium]|nr:hypothetical protein [Myxococcales bacterium]MDD9971432.1 hypothetical protein [Myxococcales bacterium]